MYRYTSDLLVLDGQRQLRPGHGEGPAPLLPYARSGILNTWIGNEADIRLNYGIQNFYPCCA